MSLHLAVLHFKQVFTEACKTINNPINMNDTQAQSKTVSLFSSIAPVIAGMNLDSIPPALSFLPCPTLTFLEQWEILSNPSFPEEIWDILNLLPSSFVLYMNLNSQHVLVSELVSLSLKASDLGSVPLGHLDLQTVL